MSRIIQSAQEALAIAKGEMDPKEYAVHSVAVSCERNRTVIDAKSAPNAETIAAMEECRNPATLKSYATPSELWAELDADL
ncbi:MAG: hypothetical protein EOL87_18480 [Spartobacteria bacterium]|nr:hypothetical protein [Spartobacteria bacterium]